MEIRFELFFSCGGDVGQARDNSDVPSCGRENNINLTQRGEGEAAKLIPGSAKLEQSDGGGRRGAVRGGGGW